MQHPKSRIFKQFAIQCKTVQDTKVTEKAPSVNIDCISSRWMNVIAIRALMLGMLRCKESDFVHYEKSLWITWQIVKFCYLRDVLWKISHGKNYESTKKLLSAIHTSLRRMWHSDIATYKASVITFCIFFSVMS